MGRSRPLIWLAPLLFPLFLGAQTAPELANILQRLDRLEQENRTLSEEVRALRADLAAARLTKGAGDSAGVQPSAAATPAPGATVDEKLDIQQQRIDEQAQTKVEASQRFPIRITGMALFNAFLNSKQSGGVNYPILASEPGVRSSGATLRQTIVGLEFHGPATVWGGRVHGSIYMDFFPGTTYPEMRLRTGSVGIDWQSRSVTVGIDKPIFNGREPSSLAQVGISPLTGAGNLYEWLPQIRAEQDFHFSRSTGLRAVMGVVQTHEIGPYGQSNDITEASRPGLEGRFEFFHSFDEERRLEIAPGFHTSTTHSQGMSVPSSLFSLDWFFNPWRRVEFSGAFYTGQNVAHLGTGTGQGYQIDPEDICIVESRGGWGQITVHTLKRLDLHFFTGQTDDSNSVLSPGNIGKNLLYGGNAYFHLAPNVLLGLEATQLRTVYLNRGTRINNHYDLALAYLF